MQFPLCRFQADWDQAAGQAVIAAAVFLQDLCCGIGADLSVDPILGPIFKVIHIVRRRLGRAGGISMLQLRCSIKRNMKSAR
jgi:hypothetical protein